MDKAQPSELVERLRRKEQRYPAQGGGSIGTNADGKVTSTGYVTDDGYRLANPDGPEAADLIERLTPTPEPCRLREALVEAREYVEAYCQEHGETGTALQARLNSLLTKIDSALSASPAEPEEVTEAMDVPPPTPNPSVRPGALRDPRSTL